MARWSAQSATGHGLVTSLNHLHKIESMPQNEVDARLQREANEMLRQIAMMPDQNCKVTVTASINGNEINRFEMVRDEAKEKVAQTKRRRRGR